MAYLVKKSRLDLYSPQFICQDGPPRFFQYPLPLYRGQTLDAEDVPTWAKEKTKFKRLPDFMMISESWVVCQTFKEIAEELEPKVHQYFPIRLHRRLKGVDCETYYFLNIRQSIDAIIYEESDIVWNNSNAGFAVPHFGNDKPRILLEGSKTKGLHMWHGNKFFTQNVFFSDDLYQAVTAAKLKKLDAVHAEERLEESAI